MSALQLKAWLVTLAAFLAPFVQLLSPDATFSCRSLAAATVAGLIAGSTALGAFLNTAYAKSLTEAGKQL